MNERPVSTAPRIGLFPIGKLPLYRALQDAGVQGLKGDRNIRWIMRAADGVVVYCAWYHNMEKRDGKIVNVVEARSKWTDAEALGVAAKRDEVIAMLAASAGQDIRLVIVESKSRESRESDRARFDGTGLWRVEDTGDAFLLWRHPLTARN
jgi:hypothetical protein